MGYIDQEPTSTWCWHNDLGQKDAFQEFEHTKSQEVDFFDSWTTLDDHLHGGLSVMSDAVKPTATNPPIWDAWNPSHFYLFLLNLGELSLLGLPPYKMSFGMFWIHFAIQKNLVNSELCSGGGWIFQLGSVHSRDPFHVFPVNTGHVWGILVSSLFLFQFVWTQNSRPGWGRWRWRKTRYFSCWANF